MNASESDIRGGVCPRCGADEVRVQRRGWGHRNVLPTGFWGPGLRVENYACAACGYLESYVDPADLGRLREKWPRLRSPVPR